MEFFEIEEEKQKKKKHQSKFFLKNPSTISGLIIK